MTGRPLFAYTNRLIHQKTTGGTPVTPEDCPDHRILDIALTLQHDEEPRIVVLVTKDTNLRMKAKSLGIRAQDYSTDKVESMDKLYSGKRLLEGLSSSVLEQFYHGEGIVAADQLECVKQPIANENFVLRIRQHGCDAAAVV